MSRKTNKIYKIISGIDNETLALGLKLKSTWLTFPSNAIFENLEYLKSINAYVEEFEVVSTGKKYDLGHQPLV